MKARPLLRGGAPAVTPAPTRILDTARFGRITYDPATVIWCDLGLCREHAGNRYLLLPWAGRDRLLWLQSVDVFDCARLVTDPLAWSGEYRPELEAARLREIGLLGADDENAALLCLVDDPRLDHFEPESIKGPVTMNLAFPIVINTRGRRAAQFADPSWATRHVIDPAADGDGPEPDQPQGGRP